MPRLPRAVAVPLAPVALAPFALALLGLAGASRLAADPPPAAEPAAGPVYKNAELGLTLAAPKGWTLTAETTQAPQWTRMAQFVAPGASLEVTVSRRARQSASLAELEAQIKREWQAEKGFNVTALASVEPSSVRPVGLVRVEANQTRKPAASRPGAAATPAAPVIWQVEAAYVLAGTTEVRVYAEGPLGAWTNARAQVRALIDSLALASPAKAAEGEGTFRDDLRGFGVRYPKGYGVVVPQRERHVVEFVPLAPDQPVLGVYLLSWEQGVSQDAERLVKHYKDERGGEASSKPEDVAGQPGAWVTARVTENGRDTVVLLALVKRGNDLFRLRASMAATAQEAGTAAFRAFVASFTLSAPAR